MAAKKKSAVKKKSSPKKNAGKKTGKKATKKTVRKKKVAGASTKKTGNSKKDKGLTHKEELACQAFIENGGNKSEAYRSAYDTEKQKDTTVWENASRLFARDKVLARVKQLQAEHRERHNVTVDSLTDEYDQNRATARTFGQATAMNQATTGKAKLHGLVTEKQQLLGKDGKPIDPNAQKEPWVFHVVDPGGVIPDHKK